MMFSLIQVDWLEFAIVLVDAASLIVIVCFVMYVHGCCE